MANPTLNNPPKFLGPNAPGPANVADWQQFIRWLVQVFQASQTNTENVAELIGQIDLAIARPSLPATAPGLNLTSEVAAIVGQVQILEARPQLPITAPGLNLQDEMASLEGDFELLLGRPNLPATAPGLNPDAEIQALNESLGMLLAKPYSTLLMPQQQLPPVGPGAGTYVVGLKLTGGGTDGAITIDDQGRITAITEAT